MKIFITLLLTMAAAASPLLAWDPHTSNNKDIRAYSNSKTGLWFAAANDVTLQVNKISSMSPDTVMGYFTMDKNFNILEKSELSFDSSNKASINVSASQLVGFYMVSDGTEYSSIKKYNDPELKDFYFAGRGVNKGDRTFVFYDTVKNAQLNITFDYNRTMPTGQPLPGILVTLLAAGAVGAGVKQISKKKSRGL